MKKRHFALASVSTLLFAGLMTGCGKDTSEKDVKVTGIWEQLATGPGYKEIYNFKDDDNLQQITIFSSQDGKKVQKENLKYNTYGDEMDIVIDNTFMHYSATVKGDTLTLTNRGHSVVFVAITPEKLNDYLTKEIEMVPEPDYTEPPEDPSITPNYD